MISRCVSCGRSYLETDARRVAHVAPRCVSCLVDGCETDAETRGDMRAVAFAFRVIASVPVSWFHQQREQRGKN